MEQVFIYGFYVLGMCKRELCELQLGVDDLLREIDTNLSSYHGVKVIYVD